MSEYFEYFRQQEWGNYDNTNGAASASQNNNNANSANSIHQHSSLTSSIGQQSSQASSQTSITDFQCTVNDRLQDLGIYLQFSSLQRLCAKSLSVDEVLDHYFLHSDTFDLDVTAGQSTDNLKGDPGSDTKIEGLKTPEPLEAIEFKTQLKEQGFDEYDTYAAWANGHRTIQAAMDYLTKHRPTSTSTSMMTVSSNQSQSVYNQITTTASSSLMTNINTRNANNMNKANTSSNTFGWLDDDIISDLLSLDLSKDDIDRAILTGGCTTVDQALDYLFQHPNTSSNTSSNTSTNTSQTVTSSSRYESIPTVGKVTSTASTSSSTADKIPLPPPPQTRAPTKAPTPIHQFQNHNSVTSLPTTTTRITPSRTADQFEKENIFHEVLALGFSVEDARRGTSMGNTVEEVVEYLFENSK